MAQAQDKNKFAFILMPFDAEFNHVYSELIKPALEDEGFEVERADTTFAQQNILRTIIHNISVADLIVVELTTSNPNVFYELGIAHGLTKPVVLLTQELDHVPFDLKSYQIITYSTRFDEAPELKDRLSRVARGLKEQSIEFGSPVTDFAPADTITKLPTKSSGYGIKPQHEDETEAQDEAEHEDSGVLDLVAEVEGATDQLGSIVESFTQMLEDFGYSAESLGTKAEEISQSNAPNQAAQMRKLAKDMASAIKELGNGIQEELPTFHDTWERMETNFTSLLSTIEINDDEDREEAAELVSHLEGFQNAINPGLEAIQEARDGLKDNTGLSRDLNVAIRATTKAMDNFIGELSTGESSVIRMKNLLEQKIQWSEKDAS